MGPTGLYASEPSWQNAFENALTVQFNHRILAYLIFIYVLVMAWRGARTALPVLAAVIVQASLGIMTVVLGVPLSIALIHQGGALVLLALALWHLHHSLLRPVSLRPVHAIA